MSFEFQICSIEHLKYFMNSRDLFLALKKCSFIGVKKCRQCDSQRRNCKFQFQIRNCKFQRQSIYISTPFSNMDNIMLEVLFMVENGTTIQLTSCWSTFMHSTSSYDAQSKRYAIFKMPTQYQVCEKQRKRGTKFWQVLNVVCVDDNGDPHVNNGRGKKFGDILIASGGIEPGQNSGPVVSVGHWASSVVSVETRHIIYHYFSMPSPAPVVHSRPVPLCARCDATVCRCEHAEPTRGIWRGLYVERRKVGTHQVYGRTQASASSKKYFLLMLY